jgi:hypothetical protein
VTSSKHTDIVRLRELFPCYVSAIFILMRVLTFVAFRLNNRDNIRAPGSNSFPSKAFQLDSVQSKQNPHKSKTGSTAVSVTVHRTATEDFETKRCFSNEQELDKVVRVLHIVVTC